MNQSQDVESSADGSKDDASIVDAYGWDEPDTVADVIGDADYDEVDHPGDDDYQDDPEDEDLDQHAYGKLLTNCSVTDVTLAADGTSQIPGAREFLSDEAPSVSGRTSPLDAVEGLSHGIC